MVNKQHVSPLITLALIISCVPHTTQATGEPSTPNWTPVAAGLGTLAIVVGGVVYTCWQTSHNDQATIDNAQKTCNPIVQEYAPLLEVIPKTQDPATIDETALSSYVADRFHQKTGKINSSISLLAKQIETLQNRIKKADASSKNRLQAKLQEISELQQHLHTIELVLTRHQSYFDLFEQHAAVAKAHAREIDFANTCLPQNHADHHNDAIKYKLNGVLGLRYSASSNNLYPYVAYAAESGSDVHSLGRAIDKAHCYPVLVQQATNTEVPLRRLCEFVTTSSEYKHNIHERKKDDQTKQQLRQEQEHYAQLQQIERKRLETEKSRLQTEQERLKLEADRVGRLEQNQTHTNTKVYGIEEQLKSMQMHIKTLGATVGQQATSAANLCNAHNQLASSHNNLNGRVDRVETAINKIVAQQNNPPAYESVVAQQQPPAYQEGN